MSYDIDWDYLWYSLYIDLVKRNNSIVSNQAKKRKSRAVEELPPGTKRCRICGQVKPIKYIDSTGKEGKNFYCSKRMADGLTSSCRECDTLRKRKEYRNKRGERINENKS